MQKGFDFDPSEIPAKTLSLKRQISGLSLLRLLLFVGVLGSGVLFFSDSGFWIIALLVISGAFVKAIQRFNYLKDQEAIYKSLQKIQLENQFRADRKLKELDGGEEFLEKSHPFINDLDLFGEHSLFQLINRTQSQKARTILANRLKSSFSLQNSEEIRSAVKELSLKTDFLRSFESVGEAFYQEGKSTTAWQAWMKAPASKKSFTLGLGIVGIIGGLILGSLGYLGLLHLAWLGLWTLIGIPFLGLVFGDLKEADERIPSSDLLKTYRLWIELLEDEEFENPLLVAQKEVIVQKNGPKASILLKQLDGHLLWVQNRLNLLYIPLNLFFWTDLLLHYRLMSWKSQWGSLISELPDALADWELWVSLAAFEKAENQTCETETSKDLSFSALGMTHPLLHPEVAVANDFRQDQSGKLILLTGANMSGKTTFMRTLGINLVLLNLGVSPFAKRLQVGECQLYTSMRNSDNLGESVSSFYAELSRIKGMIDRLESGERLFFLLDEILKGTNTEDRIAGSEALIRQLEELDFLGIISTHDIELSRLEEKIDYVRNFSFHSEVKEDTIEFDYLIKEGPCPSFNAHKLMELMGIRFDGRA
ncbi:MutS-related protein [Algoriphagus formosus]|uniref:MutS-related protein n=1 Tax=Algoriphagus formosus TaxID=2007308 RepID=UPI003F72E249